MSWRFFYSKSFVTFVLLAFLLYSFSIQEAQAGGGGGSGAIFTFILKLVIGIVLYFVAPIVLFIVTIVQAVMAFVQGNLALGFLALASLLPIPPLNTLASLSNITFMGLCEVGGQSSVFYSNCGPTQTPFAYGLPNLTYNAQVPPPALINSNADTSNASFPACTSLRLCYTLARAVQYVIYRNRDIINASLGYACIPRDPNSSGYSFCYTDIGLQPSTAYTYQLVAYDAIGQPFIYPEQQLTTCTP